MIKVLKQSSANKGLLNFADDKNIQFEHDDECVDDDEQRQHDEHIEADLSASKGALNGDDENDEHGDDDTLVMARIKDYDERVEAEPPARKCLLNVADDYDKNIQFEHERVDND